MTVVRAFRIAGIAAAFWCAFTFSQAATRAREGTTIEGIHWAIGALSVMFLVNAFLAERFQGAEANLRKDLLWGLAAGGIAIFLGHF